MRLLPELHALFRSTSRSPGQAVAIWACTAVWIAVSPALLSLLGVLQWRSFPFPGSERIVQVNAGVDLVPILSVSGPFQTLATYEAGWLIVEGPQGTSTVLGAAVEEGFFEVFANRPLLGHVFSPGGPPSDVGGVVVTEGLGRRVFGSLESLDRAVVRVEGRSLAVLGVVADRPVYPPTAELWVLAASGIRPDRSFLPPKVSSLGIVGRLSERTSVQAADVVVRRAAQDFEERKDLQQGDVEVTALADLYRRRSGGERALLRVSLAGLLGFVLLAYASALSGFLAKKEGELAVRVALGARRLDLVRLLWLQIVVLAVPGFFTGLPAAVLVLKRLSDLVPASLAELVPPRLDTASLAMAVAGWGGATLLSVAGAWLTAPRIGLGSLLVPERSEARRTRPQARIRLAFVCAALSLAVALGAVTAVLRQSVINLQEEPLGFEPHNSVSAVVRFAEPPGTAKLPATFARLGDRAEQVPGVAAVGFSDSLPFGAPGRSLEITSPERSRLWMGRIRGIYGDYLQAAGLRLLAGRTFTPLEEEIGAPVALLDVNGAREVFGGPPFAGRWLKVDQDLVEVVGVVASTKGSSLEEEPRPQVYLPLLRRSPESPPALVALARISGAVDEGDFLDALAEPGVSASRYRLVAEDVEESLSARRLLLDLAFLQWAAALVLVTLTTFWTFSWLLELRSHEHALRLALGDSRGGIARRILLSALRILAAAVVLGLALYTVAGQTLRSLLFGVDVLSPPALLQAVSAVGGATLGAVAVAAKAALGRLSLDRLGNTGA